MKRATTLRNRAHPVRQVSGNPFKELREGLNLTLEDLARRTNLSKQAIIRCEQGTYSQPLPALMSFFTDRGEKAHDLSTRYSTFQSRTRGSNLRLFGENLPTPFDYGDLTAEDSLRHPFRVIRGGYNPTEVAKALCVPQATITYFERKPIQQKTVPKAIVEALVEIGYTRTEVHGLIVAYANYRESLTRRHTSDAS